MKYLRFSKTRETKCSSTGWDALRYELKISEKNKKDDEDDEKET